MSKRDIFEYMNYIDQLSPKEKEYIKKFYNELYYADIYNPDVENINDISDPEVKKEIVRATYSRQNDVMGNSSKAKVKYGNKNKEQFMEDASDEWEWKDGYAEGGYELAVKFIFNQTLKDLDNNKVDKTTTLLRFYTKMSKLRRMKERKVK